MARIPPILQAKQKASVLINGVLVPLDGAKYSLEKFSRPLVFYNGPPFDVSVVGSCMLARFRGENFLIATRHQLGKGDKQRPETEVCVALFDNARSRLPTLLTPSGGISISFDDAEDKFLEDILVLTFEREKHKLVQLNLQFLQLDEMKCLDEVDPRRIIHYLTIAFPSVGSQPALKSDGMGFEGFESGFVRLALEPSGDASPDQHIAFRVKEKVRKERDFDGYSGAPVYFIFVDDTDQAHVGWAGIKRWLGLFEQFPGLSKWSLCRG